MNEAQKTILNQMIDNQIEIADNEAKVGRCDGKLKEAIIDFVVKELYPPCEEHEQIMCNACIFSPELKNL